MTAPFYVSPQQVLADRAEYARKGIARGRSIVACEVDGGILVVAENSMPSLHKVAEMYDRIAFAAVGRYNEFEALRVAGVRRADLTGYSYSREDVTARALGGAYSQSLGQIFTHELKPMEVEILVAEVGIDPDGSGDSMFRVTFDGQISDEKRFMAMGGDADSLSARISADYEDRMGVADAIELAVTAMVAETGRAIGVSSLEVALLARADTRRCFSRIEGEELAEMLGADEITPDGTGSAGDEA